MKKSMDILWVLILLDFFESPSPFRVQFVCKSGGNYGDNGHKVHSFALFLDIMDAITPYEHGRH